MQKAAAVLARSTLAWLMLIAMIVGGSAAVFAYTAGWLSPQRITPDKVVAAFAPPGGPALGHRRNHAKGICFTGVFESNGDGSELSKAQVFVQGRYPVVGRFNLGTPNAGAADRRCASAASEFRSPLRMGRNGAAP